MPETLLRPCDSSVFETRAKAEMSLQGQKQKQHSSTLPCGRELMSRPKSIKTNCSIKDEELLFILMASKQ